jgi:hypothetical protein
MRVAVRGTGAWRVHVCATLPFSALQCDKFVAFIIFKSHIGLKNSYLQTNIK